MVYNKINMVLREIIGGMVRRQSAVLILPLRGSAKKSFYAFRGRHIT
jgi:hypothetical protein